MSTSPAQPATPEMLLQGVENPAALCQETMEMVTANGPDAARDMLNMHMGNVPDAIAQASEPQTDQAHAEALLMNEGFDMSQASVKEHISNLNETVGDLESKVGDLIKGLSANSSAEAIRQDEADQSEASQSRREKPGILNRMSTQLVIGGIAVVTALGLGSALKGDSDTNKLPGSSAAPAQPENSKPKADPNRVSIGDAKTVRQALDNADVDTAGERRWLASDVQKHPGRYDDLRLSYDGRSFSKVGEFSGKKGDRMGEDKLGAQMILSAASDKSFAEIQFNQIKGKSLNEQGSASYDDKLKVVADHYGTGVGKQRTLDADKYSNTFRLASSKVQISNHAEAKDYAAVSFKSKHGSSTTKTGGGSTNAGCGNALLENAEAERQQSEAEQTTQRTQVAPNPDKPGLGTEINPTPTPTPTPKPDKPKDKPEDKPETTPKPEPEGKNHERSPVTGDPNHPDEDRRPNIPAPPVAIQPEGEPAVDPYVPPVTVPVPEGVDPEQADPTPADETATPDNPVEGEVPAP